MSDRSDELIGMLGLLPHPERGHYHEVFRSPHTVQDARGTRSALTTIYFLLRAGEHSSLHRVHSDEAWHFYEGDPLELVWCGDELAPLERARLGPPTEGQRPVAVVPAASWQAARTTGRYSLVGCSVAPGFEFDDFALFGDDPVRVERLRKRAPHLEEWL